MVVDDRLPNALADRDVIETLERETRVHAGASLRYRADNMRRRVRVAQRSGNATTHFLYNVAPLSPFCASEIVKLRRWADPALSAYALHPGG
jgi:hypothetical protein